MSFDSDQRGGHSRPKGQPKTWNVESTVFVPGSSRLVQPKPQQPQTFAWAAPPNPEFNYPSVGSSLHSSGTISPPPLYDFSPTGPPAASYPISDPHYFPKLSHHNPHAAHSSSRQPRGVQQQPYVAPSQTPNYAPPFYQRDTQATSARRGQPAPQAPQRLQFNYAPTALPSQVHIQHRRRPSYFFFYADPLNKELTHQSTLFKDSDPALTLPTTVGEYHSLYPLEPAPSVSKSFGILTAVYKCQSSRSSSAYALRKVDPPNATNLETAAAQATKSWHQFRHSGLVSLRQVLLMSSSLYYAYDYYPGAETLHHQYLATSYSGYIQEEVLWSLITQLVALLVAVHDRGLALGRALSLSNILRTSKNKFRVNCVGVDTAIAPETPEATEALQRADLAALGDIILMLTSKSANPANNYPELIHQAAQNFSNHLAQLIGQLTPSTGHPTLTVLQVAGRINSHFTEHFERLSLHNHLLEGDLAKEIQNGRLLRLAVKLGFINERPEYQLTSLWREEGDRQLIQLFRHYVFHQSEDGVTPIIDFGHVVECLNKLDVGTDDTILLQSRNEKTKVIVSYKEIKKLIADTFGELVMTQAKCEPKGEEYFTPLQSPSHLVGLGFLGTS